MNKMTTYLILFGVVCMGMAVMGCGRTDSPPDTISAVEPFTKTTLDNGLDVIVKEVHSAPIVAVYFWCDTGSVNEDPAEYGISHFYEHMFFKGTEKRGVGEIDRAIKSLGGYNNAFTSKEYTAYYVVLPSDNFELASDVLVDAIRNSAFPADEIEKERGVILEEINRKDDNPTGTLYDELFAVMFPGTPYAHPVLGTRESVSNITREDFQDYLGSYYVPNNMTAVVVGDVTAADAVERIRTLTAGWEPDPAVDEREASFEVPQIDGVKEFTLEKDVTMSYAMMAFQTSGYTDKKENATLDVVTSILGEGRSSRLYRRLVEEEQVVASVQSFIYPLSRTGLLIVMASLETRHLPQFRESLMDELVKLRNETVPPEELEKVQTMLKADFQFANETASDIASTLGHYNTLDMMDVVTRYEESIEGVTAEDIQTYVGRVVTPDAYAFGVITPRGTDAQEGSDE